MTERWIVDASNVMGSRPDGWWRDRSLALHRLLDEVIRWHDEAGEPVTLVCDGHPSHRVPEGDAYGVIVRYAHSATRDAADAVIASMVRADDHPTGLAVVTSDRELREQVARLGARVERSGAFLTRIADIPSRRADRAVLAAFGTDESAFLGRGGEARVFALDGERVLRLPHPGVPAAALEDRRRMLEAIGDPSVVVTPEVVEHRDIDGRLVVIERRLAGDNALDLLGRLETGAPERAALVRHHLDVSSRIAALPCPADRFGEIFDGGWGTRRATFREWASSRVAVSLRLAGQRFAGLSPDALTDAMVAALEPVADADDRPRLAHLDAFLGNMLADGDRVTAVIDFGPTTIGGVPGLDPAASVAYLAPEITPTATDGDRAVARGWADDHGLTHALEPVERWLAAYWSAIADDHHLRRWCTRVLLGADQ